MPKNVPKEGANWGIEVTEHSPMTGKPICKPDGTHQKIKIRMKDTQLPNGQPQPLYFPEGHPWAGIFKGMAVILEERGFRDLSKKWAECKKFACAPGKIDCCCWRMLYTETDFANVDSVLQTICALRGFQVIFLPKFHCELNFIEQCWEHAKGVYRTYSESSREDVYDRGLNGRQAAWVSRKYCRHRVLPNDILEELGKEGVM